MNFNKYVMVFIIFGIQNTKANTGDQNIGLRESMRDSIAVVKQDLTTTNKKMVVSTQWSLNNQASQTEQKVKRYADLSPYVSDQKNGSNIITIGPEASCDATYEALAAIVSVAESGDELHLAAGSYTSNLAQFDITDKSLTVIGGYSQDCQTLMTDQKTTLRLTGTDDEVFDIKSINSQVNVVLANLIIEGGAGLAGGIHLQAPVGGNNSGLNLVNSVIRNNNGTMAGGVMVENATLYLTETTGIQANESDNYGGGISCFNSEIGIQNALVSLNESASDGGGIYLDNCDMYMYGYPGELSSVAFNQAINGGGGGIFATNSSLVEIEGQNASVSFNKASNDAFASNYGGGVNVNNNSHLNLYSAQVSNNESFAGGGLWIGTNSVMVMGRRDSDQCNLAQCSRVTDNRAISSHASIESFAGGIYSESTAVSDISQTWVTGNEADYSSALSINQGAVKHSMILNNSNLSTDGGSFLKSTVNINGSNLDFNFNTLAKNSFVTNNVAVVAVGSQVTEVNVAGNIIQENVFVNQPSSIHVGNPNSTGNCNHNLLETSTASSFCNDPSNLDAGDEAMFVDPINNDFHITPQSLAVNHAASVPIGVAERDIDNDVILIADAGADETLEPRVGLNGGACSFVTIASALNAANFGDVLFLSPGIYNESLFITENVDLLGASSDCTQAITGSTSNTVILDGTGVTDNNALVVIQGDKQVALSNLTIQKSVRGGLSKLAVTPEDSAPTILTNVRVFSNTSPFDGAGIFVPANSVLELRGDTVISNNFSLSAGSRGGGIFVGKEGLLNVFDNVSVGLVNQPNIADNGGGIYVFEGSFYASGNTRIIANQAENGGGVYADGEEARVDCQDCIFQLNHTSSQGGSIYMNEALLILNDSDLIDNHSDQYGGAMYLNNAKLILSESRFTGNNAGFFGGGMYVERNNNNAFSLSSVDFISNSSENTGGAIFVRESPQNFNAIQLESVSFINNTAVNQGGAVFLGSKQSLNIFNSFGCVEHVGIGYDYCSQFYGNSTSATNGVGGAIFNQGFINVNLTAFQQNSAAFGSAIYSLSSDGIVPAGATIRNSLFAQNSGDSTLRLDTRGSAIITATTWANNNRSFHVLPDSSTFSVEKSILWGDQLSSLVPNGNTGECNIDEFGVISENTQNPLFETGLNGINYLLSVNSPAIDQCIGTPGNGSFDLIGNDRITDGNYHPSSDESDMGAFEFIAPESTELTVNLSGDGTGAVVSQLGELNCSGSCSDEFPLGFEVTLQAMPTVGMEFVGWSGSGCSGVDDCTLVMDQNTSVTAEFMAADADLIFRNSFE